MRILFLLLLPLLGMAEPLSPIKKVYITPGYWGQLFSVSNPIYNRDDCLGVLDHLRKVAYQNGIQLEQADSLDNLGDFEYLVVFDVFLDQLPMLEKYPKEKLILFLWEPPTVLPNDYILENHKCFSKVFTWNDDLVDGVKYFKFFYPVMNPQISDPIDFYFKRFGALIACNKSSAQATEIYSERIKLIHFFEHLPEAGFDLYGKWWPSEYRNYHGPISSKLEVLKYYRFSFAYENTKNVPGYITEKIFDSFQAGTVPIYLGAPNVWDYIPENCFIHRDDFQTDMNLYEYLISMPRAEYESYLENIRQFLQSDQAKLFSKEHFITIFMRAITQ